jgi:uncharacterized damage-inducible protein DinB/transcriptional antiterminator Rof (Rho-off)
MADYTPIDCNYYDQLEAHATLKTWLRVDDIHDEAPSYVTKIVDFQTANKVEYAIDITGKSIRLDQLALITPLDPTKDVTAHLLNKMDYNYWANKLMLDTLDNHDYLPHQVISWMSHIFNAHDIWNKRIQPTEVSHYDVWEVHPRDQWAAINEEIHRSSYEILGRRSPSEIIKYNSTADYEYRHTISDIVYHIVNHSTYHGGQIVYEMRREGLVPVSTDFIRFCRL